MNEQTPQPTCEERIDEELSHELERIREALERYETLYDCEYTEDILEVALQTRVKFLLSTGGPADGFCLTFDPEGTMVEAEYFFQDWYDGATRTLSAENSELVERMLRPLVEHWLEERMEK